MSAASILTGKFKLIVDGSQEEVKSEVIEVAGCKWYVEAEKANEDGTLELSLICENLAESAAAEVYGRIWVKRGGKTTFRSEHWTFTEEDDFNGFYDLGEFPTTEQEPYSLDVEFTVLSAQNTRIRRTYSFDSADSCPGVSNIVFVVGPEKKRVYASKEVLAAASPVFHKMFFGDFKEANENEVTIADERQDDFVNFIAHIYHCRNSMEHTESLMRLADYYDVGRLVEECEQFYLGKVHELPTLYLVEIACKYRFPSLLAKVAKHMTVEELEELKETEEWVKLSDLDRAAILEQVIRNVN